MSENTGICPHALPCERTFLLRVWSEPRVQLLASNADALPGSHCWEAFFVDRALDCPAAYAQPLAHGSDAVVLAGCERFTRIGW